MKQTCVILLIVALGVAFFFGFAHILNVSDREHFEREQAWQAFTMEHHCVVTKPPTFWNGDTTWACESGFLEGGFQVVRGPQ